MKEAEIKSLLSKISKKDEASFSKLFNAYYPKLVQLALAFVPEIAAAQEIVSDVFYKILKNPIRLEGVVDFNQYIFVAVRNQSFTYLNKNKHKTFFDSIDQKEDQILYDHKNPESSLISDELFSIVDEAIQNLPPKRKAIFLLIKEEGRKYKEIVQEYQQSKDIKIRKIDGTGITALCLTIIISLLL